MTNYIHGWLKQVSTYGDSGDGSDGHCDKHGDGDGDNHKNVNRSSQRTLQIQMLDKKNCLSWTFTDIHCTQLCYYEGNTIITNWSGFQKIHLDQGQILPTKVVGADWGPSRGLSV